MHTGQSPTHQNETNYGTSQAYAMQTPLTQHNSSQSPPQEHKYKRNYRACLNCRVRKVKCDLGPVDNPHDGKCARCLRERKDCVFVESKRGGASNVLNGRRKRQKHSNSGEYERSQSPELASNAFRGNQEHNAKTNATAYGSSPQSLPGINSLLHEGDLQDMTNLSRPSPQSHESMPNEPTPSTTMDKNKNDSSEQKTGQGSHFATMEGALVFLASAAGTIAKADERDNIDARTKYDQIEAMTGNNSHRTSIDENNLSPQINQGKGNTPYMSRHGSQSQHTQSQSSNFDEAANSSCPTGRDDLITNQQRSKDYPPQPSRHNSTDNTTQHVYPFMNPTRNKRMTMPAAESGYAIRPKASKKLSSIEYIGSAPHGILTEEEAERLINLFFSTMHPYFPHIPKFLHSSKVLSGYPILLCAILTISSRYHPFENNASSLQNGNVPRNIEVHDRLWLYVQRLISQTVWAEASTRSIGTIFAFLLFTEWNPRAIHWRWSDYANKAEEGGNENDAGVGGLNAQGGGLGAMNATTAAFGRATGGNNGGSADGSDGNAAVGGSNLAGLGAMRRSHRMAWMLIGSAVRLAQDMGFMEMSSKTLIATHIAEINSVMDISRRSMLAHSLSEIDLDEDEISEEDTEFGEDVDDDVNIMKMSEEELKRAANEHTFKFTKAQKAQIELLQIMSLGHESFYGYKAQLGQLSQRQNLAVLNIISPLINNWSRKYRQLLVPTSGKLAKHVSNFQHQWTKPNSKICLEVNESIQQESFIFEFNYVKLYIYSLALSPSPRTLMGKKNSRVSLKLDELSRSARFIEQAFNAANEMLNAAHRIHKFKMLRFMPVRWLTRLVRAVAFIVKCYLTITAQKNGSGGGGVAAAFGSSSRETYDPTVLSFSLISIDDISSSIHRAALTLRDCSPDELHLCTRYSNILMYLYSEMKNKKNDQDELDIDRGYHYSQGQDSVSDRYQAYERERVQNIAQTGMSSAIAGTNQSQQSHKISSNDSFEQLTPQNQPYEKSDAFPYGPYFKQPTNVPTSAPIAVGVTGKPNSPMQHSISNTASASASGSASASATAPASAVPPPEDRQHQTKASIPTAATDQIGTSGGAFSQPTSVGNNTSGEGTSAGIGAATNSSNVIGIGDSEVMDWFMNNQTIGLDFVAPWTEMIEQQLNSTDQNFYF
ncbi:ARO80 [Candida margitis]|uniref:ARO80 n=1 Tax=Candida margitis TaxID=1775924 RepID=UPI002226E804|nr:ARO80 [Candida margitis]KAI5961729.1 ARO80 [Candida margitis]